MRGRSGGALRAAAVLGAAAHKHPARAGDSDVAMADRLPRSVVRWWWRRCSPLCARQARGSRWGSRARSTRSVLTGLGGLDQRPAGVAVAGLGDVSAMPLTAGGVFKVRD